ncbi:MAG TPA: SAM-dependent methyltransferase, partial [Lachnospiraceae bacterium]|nr:SAM-dependent methyltransferase [Lachnospiraceae bacterium]
MFWDKVAKLYDFSETLYNGKVNLKLCKEVEDMIDTGDDVLECACGTGMLSRHIGQKCNRL